MKSYLWASIILLALVTLGHLLSRVYGFYFEYWWFDILLHTLAGAAIGFFWLWLSRNSLPDSRFFIFASAVSVAVLGSFLWEVWEYTNWRIFPWTTVYIQEARDMLGDILSGMVGGFLVAIWHFARHKI